MLDAVLEELPLRQVSEREKGGEREREISHSHAHTHRSISTNQHTASIHYTHTEFSDVGRKSGGNGTGRKATLFPMNTLAWAVGGRGLQTAHDSDMCFIIIKISLQNWMLTCRMCRTSCFALRTSLHKYCYNVSFISVPVDTYHIMDRCYGL